jgi:hypothetical protein
MATLWGSLALGEVCRSAGDWAKAKETKKIIPKININNFKELRLPRSCGDEKKYCLMFKPINVLKSKMNSLFDGIEQI